MIASPSQLSITSKLSALLLIFILIFYGTLVDVFIHVKKMMRISEQIVSINNTVSAQLEVMLESLLEMDSSDKKYRLLQKDIYREYFELSQINFETGMTVVLQLTEKGYLVPAEFFLLSKQYNELSDDFVHTLPIPPHTPPWINEDTLNTWIASLVQVKDSNDSHIEQSLLQLHERSLQTTRNGMFGFCFSVIAAFFGVWFISRSILTPLKQLTQGLRTLSRKDYRSAITVSSKDEFSELATAYNEMSRELQEEENLRADFIATLSHEIRTPLSSIQESVNMITEEVFGAVNEKQAKFLRIASSEISRINQLMNHLMHVSMLEAGSAICEPELLEPTELVRRATTSLTSSAEIKNISFSYDFSPNLPFISGVQEELQQVFINLVGNAIKFSPDGSQVQISVQETAAPGHLLFRISDQGPGIQPEEISLVFSKYYRSKTVRKHMDGIGLGLSISKKIVESLGGKISIQNNTGPGCTFSLSLPHVKIVPDPIVEEDHQ